MSFVAGLRPLDTSPVSSPEKDRSKNMIVMVVVKISPEPTIKWDFIRFTWRFYTFFIVSLTIKSEVMALSPFIKKGAPVLLTSYNCPWALQRCL